MNWYVWSEDPVEEFIVSMIVLLCMFGLIPYAFWKYLKWCDKKIPNEKGACEFCGVLATGFYVLYEWNDELQTNVSITGAYLCDSCKFKYGYDE